MKNSYRYFINKDCKYYPCHAMTNDSGVFNCLFCFCPLYYREGDCGGKFKILPNGIKDCSNCLIPHTEYGYEYIINKLKEE